MTNQSINQHNARNNGTFYKKIQKELKFKIKSNQFKYYKTIIKMPYHQMYSFDILSVDDTGNHRNSFQSLVNKIYSEFSFISQTMEIFISTIKSIKRRKIVHGITIEHCVA